MQERHKKFIGPRSKIGKNVDNFFNAAQKI
jgi:hypothetical protein